MKLRTAVEAGRDLLKNAGIEDAAFDARFIMEHALGIEHEQFFMASFQDLDPACFKPFFEGIRQRCDHVPLQHIVGSICFMGLDIHTDGRALIPRQETELLAERAVKYSEEQPDRLTTLDLCTGSGCIAIALARLGNFASVTASELSDEALELAAENIRACDAEVELVKSDMFSSLDGRRFDVIVSNPPYIRRDEIAGLMEEVRAHDPLMALDGGADGLDYYRIIAAQAGEHLNENGLLLLEIGSEQGEDVKRLLEAEGFTDIEIHKDYAWLDRIVSARGGGNV